MTAAPVTRLETRTERVPDILSGDGMRDIIALNDRTFRNLGWPMPPDRFAVRGIQLEVANHFGVPLTQMVGDSRNANIVNARHVAMFRCFEEKGLSMRRIAEAFHKDHTTICHAIKRVQRRPDLIKAARSFVSFIHR